MTLRTGRAANEGGKHGDANVESSNGRGFLYFYYGGQLKRLLGRQSSR